VAGYPDWRAVGAVLSTRRRLALAMGCAEADIATRFEEGIRRPIEAVRIDRAPCQDVVLTGADADLTRLPIQGRRTLHLGHAGGVPRSPVRS
jgi:3-polyprenyl-4-hydroxybenzoate decarboxylase